MLYSQWKWTSIAKFDDNYDNYCELTYFSGYNSPECSTALLNACSNDKKCTVCHDFFGCDDGTIFCDTNSDCDECKCVGSKIIKRSLISLYVFLGIGVLLELIRTLNILSNVCNKTIDIKNGSFQWSQDSILFRLIQIFNYSLWKKLMTAYNNKEFFKKSGYWWMDLFFHQIPAHILALIIMANMDNEFYRNKEFGMY